MHQNTFGGRHPPGTALGSLNALRLPSRNRGPTSKGMEGDKGREEKGRKGNGREGEGGNSPWPAHFSEASAVYVHRRRTKFADRAFYVAGPTVWNSLLPESVRSAETLASFKC